MRFLSAFLVGVVFWSCAAYAQQYQASVNSTAILRGAPSSQAAQLGSIPTGTTVDVAICFDRGAYCAVSAAVGSGFIAGELLTESTTGQTLAILEAQRWRDIESRAPLAELGGTSSDIVAWGDSLTAGAGGGTGGDYPNLAAQYLPGRLIENLGIGGQTSSAIAARMNAIPTLITLENGSIAPVGQIAVVDRSVTPITIGGPMSFSGTLCGTHGTLSAATTDRGQTYNYTYSADSVSGAISCPALSPFVFDLGEQMRPRTAWLWLGRNGAAPGRDIAADIAAAVSSLGHDRYLVGSILPADFDGQSLKQWTSLNAALRQKYGKHFVDLVSALQAAGDGSADDQSDTAQGLIPRSLRSDGLHLNGRGYAVVAQTMADATIANGY